jgi:hypothetical protein
LSQPGVVPTEQTTNCQWQPPAENVCEYQLTGWLESMYCTGWLNLTSMKPVHPRGTNSYSYYSAVNNVSARRDDGPCTENVLASVQCHCAARECCPSPGASQVIFLRSSSHARYLQLSAPAFGCTLCSFRCILKNAIIRGHCTKAVLGLSRACPSSSNTCTCTGLFRHLQHSLWSSHLDVSSARGARLCMHATVCGSVRPAVRTESHDPTLDNGAATQHGT